MNDSLWNLKAKLYRAIRSRFPFNLILKGENKRLELILHSIDLNGKRIIDLGTGTGNVLQFLASSNFVVGIDLTLSMLKMAKQFASGANLIQASALELPIKKNSFELVTVVGLSEYVKNIKLLLMEMYRILRFEGFLILTFSPFGIWTRLRLLLGHQVYPRALEDLISIAKSERFQVIKNSYSLMQGQVLFQKF